MVVAFFSSKISMVYLLRLKYVWLLLCFAYSFSIESVLRIFNVSIETKIMASGPIISWQIDEETVETVPDFIFWGCQNHCRW